MSSYQQQSQGFYEQEINGNMANKIEVIILSSVMIAPQQQAKIFLRHVPKYWLTEQYYAYYEAIKKAYENKNLDSAYIVSLLLNEYKQKEFEVMNIFASQYCVPNIMDYLQFLEQKYILRKQYELSRKLHYATNDYQIVNIEQELEQNKMLHRGQYAIKSFAEWAKFYKENDVNIEKYELGISFLDRTLHGGIELGQLVLVSGEFEAGKTSLVLQILENLSRNHKTCLFSFEFPIHTHILKRQQVFKKMLQDKKITLQNVENIAKNMIIIDEGTDINEIENQIIALSIEGVKFFAIDSQMCIFNEEFIGLGEQEESSKFAILSRLAKKHNIIIILIVQTSKGDSTSPMGSKKGAYFSSIMIRIENVIDEKTKEIDYKRKKIIFQKNKQTGENHTHNVVFDKEIRSFYEVTYPQSQSYMPTINLDDLNAIKNECSVEAGCLPLL